MLKIKQQMQQYLQKDSFSESGKMSSMLQNCISSLLYLSKTHCRFCFDVEAAVLHSQEKKCSKNGA